MCARGVNSHWNWIFATTTEVISLFLFYSAPSGSNYSDCHWCFDHIPSKLLISIPEVVLTACPLTFPGSWKSADIFSRQAGDAGDMTVDSPENNSQLIMHESWWKIVKCPCPSEACSVPSHRARSGIKLQFPRAVIGCLTRSVHLLPFLSLFPHSLELLLVIWFPREQTPSLWNFIQKRLIEGSVKADSAELSREKS